MTTLNLTPFDAAAILMVLAATLGYLNQRFVGLPHSVGLVMMGAIASILVIFIDYLLPKSDLGPLARDFLQTVDLPATLLNGLLSFLLFAGALHVDLEAIRRQKWHVLALSSASVMISTVLVGVAFKLLVGLAGIEASFAWCLVFGALISPTDPVAVLGILKTSNMSPNLQAIVGGESLFNDGVGVVVFSILLAVATGADTFSWTHAADLFVVEAGGGVLVGLLAGSLAFYAMRSIDEYNVEVMITLAVVMGGYALAQALHLSGPVAMATAGLLLGNQGVEYAMSDSTQDYLLKFWSLIDEILNSILFLLIGLEVIAVPLERRILLVALLAIPVVLAARFFSVSGPLAVLHRLLPLPKYAVPLLTWGGLRGGISIALALSLPPGETKNVVLASTCAVVLFSVFVQGGSLGSLVKRLT